MTYQKINPHTSVEVEISAGGSGIQEFINRKLINVVSIDAAA